VTKNYRLYNLEHCTYICQYHLVWATKYRGKIFNDYIKSEMKRTIKQICKWKGFYSFTVVCGGRACTLVYYYSSQIFRFLCCSNPEREVVQLDKEKDQKIAQGIYLV